MTSTLQWASQRAAAEYLGISERTLHRWRQSGLLQPGTHFRRKFPNPNSPLLYKLELCEQAMSATFTRDFRTLELAGV
jgi:predicted site-specific integrase-resolvase